MNDLKFTTAGNYMNSKIDDFIYQSGLIAAGCWDKFDDYDKKAIEKFGELIIKECIEINRQELAFNAFERLMNKYNEHFEINN
jgi:hypothetical protein